MKHEWKLSSLDLFSLGMVIEGAWVYSKCPDVDVLKGTLDRLLNCYPHLRDGYYNEESKSIEWDDTIRRPAAFEVRSEPALSASCLSANAHAVWGIARKYDIKGFKKGRVAPFSATLVKLKDGVVLYVQCAHAVMDGHSFYALVRQWASLCRGEGITPMSIDQTLLPSPDAFSKEDALKVVQDSGWCRMKGKALLSMLFNLIRSNAIKYTYETEVGQQEIASLKESCDVGTNAVLSAMAAKKLFAQLPDKECFKAIFVADLRGHFPGIGNDFFGNFSQALPLGDEFAVSGHIGELAGRIEHRLRTILSSDEPEKMLRLSACASRYGLPYFYFDATDMNCPNPGTIYINNQLKFRACEIDFGNGYPLYAYPNRLSDMVKLWQPVSGGPVQIIYGGFAARLMRAASAACRKNG
ncbi:MAG TPA: hypothetical protein DHU72_03545 [Rikenellaceae bacterium]|nr:hypothetical protein [Rikenellaceae bacterium]